MAKKKNCPYCGKKEAGYKHTVTCKMKPKEVKEDIPVLPETPAPKIVPDLATEEQMCRKCNRAPAKRLNVTDWRCPNCGDYSPVKR